MTEKKLTLEDIEQSIKKGKNPKPIKKKPTKSKAGKKEKSHQQLDKEFNLNKRQSDFCHYYIESKCNATVAAIKAGYSEKTAKQIGSKLLTHIDVKRKLQSLQEVKEATFSVSRQAILKELHSIGFSNAGQVMEWDSSFMIMKPSKGMSQEELASIKSIKQTVSDGTASLQVTQHDKVRSLQILAQITGLTEGSGGDEMSDEMTAALDDMDVNGI